jgi:hypothetical protein
LAWSFNKKCAVSFVNFAEYTPLSPRPPAMSKAALLALADRVEALAGPCRKTDAAVAKAIGWVGQRGDWWSPEQAQNARRTKKSVWSFGKPAPLKYYTASLDAAVTLYPELPDTVPSCPRKATAAALRAIAAQMPEGD